MMKVKVFLPCLREKTRDKRIVTTNYKRSVNCIIQFVTRGKRSDPTFALFHKSIIIIYCVKTISSRR